MTTPQEDELRRALESRSGAPSPDFRSRLSQALSTRPSPPDLTPAIAVATVVVLTLTSVGVLVAAGHLGRAHVTAASGARTESPVPTAGYSFQLSAPSATVVWALYDPDKLYRSTDDGITWAIRSMPSPYGVHPKVTFINDREGWWIAPGSAAAYCQLQIAQIWHTTDGAASWQQLPGKGISQKQCKDGIWFFDPKHGYVTSRDANNRPTVYRTSDGGATWAGATLQDPAYFKSAPGGFTLQVLWMQQFGGALYLMVYGVQDDPNLPHDNQFVLRSTDGGASWTLVTKVTSRSVVMVTESRWLDLQGGGQSMESINGGQQFHRYPTNFQADSSNQSQIVFANSQVGYASGTGYLQLTLDGGLTWKRLNAPGAAVVVTPPPKPTAIPISAEVRLSAPTPQVVWALVGRQYLFRSIDQGQSWQQMSLPSGDFFSDLSFVDESDGWVMVAGAGGTQCSFGPAAIWQTTDAAAHWSLVAHVDLQTASAARPGEGSIAGDQCKENISFIDKERGFLDAWDPNSAPSIYRTSDGGVTWSRSRLPDPPGFQTLTGGQTLRAGPVNAFGNTMLVEADAQQQYRAQYVFKSTDGGATWTFYATAPVMSDSRVAFTTATRWLILGNNGSAQETLDAGKTWHAFQTDYHDAAADVSTFVFADAGIGYGTVGSDIQRTVDGGYHWSLIKTSWP